MDSPLRLIASNPLDQLARTLEALLVIASAPLTVEELAEAADDHVERVEAALRLVGERFAEERSGIVLEHVAGGWAFRAGREEAPACARLFERPAQRNLSQAALETLAIVAYLGPCSRPDLISSSARRRDATPARARNAFNRILGRYGRAALHLAHALDVAGAARPAGLA